MAYSSTRVKPAITTATDAGLAIDNYLDGEVDQLYANDNYLLASMTTAAYGGPYFYVGTSAAIASLSTVLTGMNLHATDTGKQYFADGTSKHEIIDSSHNQVIAGVKTFSSIPVGPSSTPTSGTQIVTKSYVDTRPDDVAYNIALNVFN